MRMQPVAIFYRNLFVNNIYPATFRPVFIYLFTNKTFIQVVNVNNYHFHEEWNSTMAREIMWNNVENKKWFICPGWMAVSSNKLNA